MQVQLIAHTQLEGSYRAALAHMLPETITDGQITAFTAIRTCYSSKSPSSIMERPIIFSPEMVKAILEGKKTQTRRVMKPQPPDYIDKLCGPEFYEPAIIDKNGEIMPGEPIYGVYDYYSGEWGAKCPYGPGEILWVRETWAKLNHNYKPDYNGNIFVYKADHITGNDGPDIIKWCSPIYMPREAARLFLKVKNIRVEKLQDITDEAARKEGFESINDFLMYWNILNKRGFTADKNPWVWVIEFEKVS